MLYKYIGRNGDLGLIKGQVYDLELYYDKFGYVIACGRKYEIPYSNIELFEHNWEAANKRVCLHCGKEQPDYCESCYQDLISKNINMQVKLDLGMKLMDNIGKVGKEE